MNPEILRFLNSGKVRRIFNFGSAAVFAKAIVG